MKVVIGGGRRTGSLSWCTTHRHPNVTSNVGQHGQAQHSLYRRGVIPLISRQLATNAYEKRFVWNGINVGYTRRILSKFTPTAIRTSHSTRSNSSTTLHQSVISSCPVYKVPPENVHIINEPTEFYETLKTKIRSAKKRIVLASLYIGQEEKELIDSLRTALTNSPDLTVTILIDYFRGQRTSSNGLNSVRCILPLLNEFPNGRVRLALYHTPDLTGFMKRVLPPRYNEGVGLMHMKVYAMDDDVILSGANLNTDYFVNRQDRYILFRNSNSLTSFYCDIVDTTSKFCYTAIPSSVTSNSDSNSDYQLITPSIISPTSVQNDQLPAREFKQKAQELIQQFLSQKILETSSTRSQLLSHNEPSAVIVCPTIQMGLFDIRHDQNVFLGILDALASSSTGMGSKLKLWITSGYLNFPVEYMKAIMKVDCPVEVLTASPKANGFYNSKGLSYYIPYCYTYLEHVFIRKAKSAGKGDSIHIREYMRPGWTYHAKGVWITRDDGTPIATVIGSTNFGFRSLHRDLECNAIVLFSNEGGECELTKRVSDNLNFLWKETETVDENDLIKEERVAPSWVRWVTRRIRYLL